MKINGEARLLLIMGFIVALGGAGMFLTNRTPGAPTAPPPTPPPIGWNMNNNFGTLTNQARHARGDAKKARLTIVEFGDFECPSCRHAYNVLMPKLEKEVSFRFIFHQFPLPQHTMARPAAIAAEAADRQGKFWPMFDAMYTGEKTPLTQTYINELAQRVGLDMKRYHDDVGDVVSATQVQNDVDLATQSHIVQTPTFIIRDENTGKIYQVVGSGEADPLIARLLHRPLLLPPTPTPTPP